MTHFVYTMSGIEIVVLVGGAIYVSKKVKERKERKQIERDIAAGIRQPEQVSSSTTSGSSRQHAAGGSSQIRQQVPEPYTDDCDDEGLPPYSRRMKIPSRHASHPEWTRTVRLPSYEEVAGTGSEEQGKDHDLAETRPYLRHMNRDTVSSSSSSVLTPLASPSNSLSSSTTSLRPIDPTPAMSGPSTQHEDVADKRRRFWRRPTSSRVAAP